MYTDKTPDGKVTEELRAYYVQRAAQAEALLAEEAADLIGVGRALFKDADRAKRESKR